MRAYSLRRRLLAWLLAATALIGLVALADTWREAVRTAQSVSDRVLAGSALAIAERVTIDIAGGLAVDIPYSSLEMLASTAQDKVFYRVDGPDGVFLTGYNDLAQARVGDAGLGFTDGVYGDVGIRTATLVRAISTGSDSISFAVTVAESTRARGALARAILLRSAVRLAVLIASVAGIVWVAVSLALRPLDRLGEAIAQRSPDDLRAVTADTPQEVAELVEAINSFMRRLETALGALRNFTGNASHQLRTPLAVVRTQLALAMRSGDGGQEAAGKADAALVRAERVLAQLLVLARVDAAAGTPALMPTDVAAQARALTAEMVPLALRRGIDLGYDGPDTALALAEPVLLDEVLRNLLDNALAYAGDGALVTVRVVQDGPHVTLSVEDNGPGLTAGQMALIATERGRMQPGPRPVRPDGTTGYGLGLAIVSEIAGLFGADITLGATDRGQGLRAELRFTKPK